MTIFVTGATGTVGRHIVDQLMEKGKEVRALTRNPDKAGFPIGVEVVKGDLMAPETFKEALHGVAAMYLLTSSDQVGNYLETNAEVVALAEEAGVQKVCLLTVYGDGEVEQAIKNSTMKWTFVQPVGFMWNAVDNWQEAIRNGKPVRELDGDVRGAIIHEADIAAVFVATLLEEGYHGQLYTLTGPEALSVHDQLDILGKALETKIPFETISLDEAKKRWQEEGYDDESIEFFIQMSTNPPEMGYTVLSTVENITGRPARTFADWASENHHLFR
ncbi:uncharacterized protein YbjT (DUF2867 family) [Aureibacillus halotolerans]|uniref:Uncharacterized protein YbjT (DUF2867 family) n=2 Tax=Aureibacillus halotolerans TaxID=1508390 RepID=A0A4R6UCA6_9BACI|nr:NAD(P)H-binding protein [Aureibacillus halotolerans]TDQ40714.1 uncharacterized protein YbjT (DUF2867 family) [Aureibacillus halotolerans]